MGNTPNFTDDISEIEGGVDARNEAAPEQPADVNVKASVVGGPVQASEASGLVEASGSSKSQTVVTKRTHGQPSVVPTGGPLPSAHVPRPSSRLPAVGSVLPSTSSGYPYSVDQHGVVESVPFIPNPDIPSYQWSGAGIPEYQGAYVPAYPGGIQAPIQPWSQGDSTPFTVSRSSYPGQHRGRYKVPLFYSPELTDEKRRELIILQMGYYICPENISKYKYLTTAKNSNPRFFVKTLIEYPNMVNLYKSLAFTIEALRSRPDIFDVFYINDMAFVRNSRRMRLVEVDGRMRFQFEEQEPAAAAENQ